MTRKEARDQAFILIFEKGINNESVEDILEAAKECRDFLEDEDGYTLKVFTGVFERQEEIDAIISKNLTGWTINRISKISLAVLRLAIFEIMYMDEIPDAVSVDEAVELCKTYSTQEDAAFVNGVLGTVVRSK
ncbi:MAG: transcription antitermination factor NusB [Clostridia bacterium]|nr:transcription antitermination factor NusB [Clostridia bacterium]